MIERLHRYDSLAETRLLSALYAEQTRAFAAVLDADCGSLDGGKPIGSRGAACGDRCAIEELDLKMGCFNFCDSGLEDGEGLSRMLSWQGLHELLLASK